ncbi:MAG: DUF4405 domain-containing protein [Rhodobacterales bacterium]|nr:DUF4405 domain-containing protein [Rhodobacterales bacterium]
MTPPRTLRRTVALTLFAVFVTLTLTGVVMFFWPGRGAHVLALGRGAWENIHLIGGFTFIAGGILHMAFNWKTLKHHLGLTANRAAPRAPSGTALPTA